MTSRIAGAGAVHLAATGASLAVSGPKMTSSNQCPPEVVKVLEPVKLLVLGATPLVFTVR